MCCARWCRRARRVTSIAIASSLPGRAREGVPCTSLPAWNSMCSRTVQGPPILFLHGAQRLRPRTSLRGAAVGAASADRAVASGLRQIQPARLDRCGGRHRLHPSRTARSAGARSGRRDRLLDRRLDRRGAGDQVAGIGAPAGAGRTGRREDRAGRSARCSRHLRPAAKRAGEAAVPRSGAHADGPVATDRRTARDHRCATARRSRC